MKASEILLEAPEDGTYVGVTFSDDSVERLKQFSEDNDIPNPTPEDEYHITVIYSRKPLPDLKAVGDYKEPLTATPKEAKLWGEDEDVLVVLLDCPELVKRHKYLMDKHKATFDFPEYTPHVTLSYDAKDFDLNSIDVSEIGELDIVSEYSDDIELDWKEKNGVEE